MNEEHVPSVLAIIPARGGSKGIPRKNLRALAGLPLISYSIATILKSKYVTDLYVSSEDDEILTIAEKFGAQTIKRNPSLSEDQVALDPVIHEAILKIESDRDESFDFVITVQPTSPLLATSTIDRAIEQIIKSSKCDTVISVREQTGLSWRLENNVAVPNFEERLNRQYLQPIFAETGSFLISRRSIISENNRIGDNVNLHVLNEKEGIDIDTFEDWNLCEYYLKTRKVLFVVSGYKEIGMGHVYNTLSIANEILNHDITFLADEKSDLAYEAIKRNNYKIVKQEATLLDEIKGIKPDAVILDILDTEERLILGLKEMGIKIISFEDLGKGARSSDLVINAMYPEKELLPNHFFGSKYFILRDEFIFSLRKGVEKEVTSVLLSFGGVDPSNLTVKVLSAISNYCRRSEIEINVIVGPGFQDSSKLSTFNGIRIFKDVKNMSDHFRSADIVFTSAGRTTFEVASIGTPAIILAQNERELTHFFASEKNGFIHLGLGSNVTETEINSAFSGLVDDFEKRKFMNKIMLENDLSGGKKRVITLIKKMIDA